MVNPIKPIETRYKGYRFRSRLEARWAVFFDAAGIPYQYEPEGFDLGSERYLPDFWLPSLNKWVEIKADELTPAEEAKLVAFHRELQRVRNEKTEAAARQGASEEPPSPSLYVIAGEPYVEPSGKLYFVRVVTGNVIRGVEQEWLHCPMCGRIDLGLYNGSDDETESIYCVWCDVLERNHRNTDEVWFYKGDVTTTRLGFCLLSPKLLGAYRRARSARFEHGESG